MAAQDQLEIIHPDGQISFVDLDPAQGFVRIGRDPENDVVIDSPEVSPFHAMLDLRQKPYQLMMLTGSGLGGVQQNNLEMQAWEPYQLNGHALMVIDKGAAPPTTPPTGSGSAVVGAAVGATAGIAGAGAAAAVATPAPYTPSQRVVRMTSAPPEHPDSVIVMATDKRDFELPVANTDVTTMTLANGGDVVATFVVSVVGLDPNWVTISPQEVNLNEGQSTTVTITITPPRHPSSSAGAHYFAFMVTSPQHPDRYASSSGRLVVGPYYEFTMGDLSPRTQAVSWFRKEGRFEGTVTNSSNADLTLRLETVDDANGLMFEFQREEGQTNLAKQIEVTLASNETYGYKVEVAPHRRPLVAAGPDRYMYSVTATPAGNVTVPLSAMGQVNSKPLIGPFWLTVIVLLLIVIAALIYRPTVQDFTVTNNMIESGESTTLQWQGSWFANVSIEPEIGEVDRVGSLTVSPLDQTKYVIRAENLLSRLNQRFFADEADLTVFVGPVRPEVVVNVTNEEIVTGEAVTLTWSIDLTDQAVLSVNGVLETIPPEQYIGNRTFTPTEDTTFTITAQNRYTTEGDPEIRTFFVRVVDPTPTPLPVPNIQRFTLNPSTITAGDVVTIEWSVQNVESISIEGVGDNLPPTGSLSQVFEEAGEISLVLLATNGQTTQRQLAQLTVNPPPTPTPVPGTPTIALFQAAPQEVTLGSAEAQNVQVAWSVTGDFTDIELSSPLFGRLTGLPSQGSRSFSLEEPVEFTLTARNTVGGTTLAASQTIEVTVITPDPVLSGTEPSRTTQLGAASLNIVVLGANFFNDSVVRVNGIDRPTSYLGPTQLIVSLSSTDLKAVGELEITVANSQGRGGGESKPVVFDVLNPIPALDTISPTEVEAGSAGFTLLVSGTGFSKASVVRWDGDDLKTTFVSSTELRATIESDLLENPEEVQVTVFAPEPGGGSSRTLFFRVTSPTPIVNVVTPNSVTIDSPGFVMTVSGSDFVDGAQVLWNGQALAGSSCTPTQCTVSVAAAVIGASPGDSKVNIQVQNPAPGPKVSNAVQIDTLKAVSTVALTPSANPVFSFQSVTWTAQINPPGGSGISPDGFVVFYYDDNTLIEAVAVVPGANPGDPGTATITLDGSRAMKASDSVPRKTVYAQYLGNAQLSASTSPDVALTVNAATTAVSLTSGTTSRYFETTALSASVSVTSTGTTSIPTQGEVRFYLNACGGTLIGTDTTIVNGNASISSTIGAPPVNAGSYSICVQYVDTAGTPDFATSDTGNLGYTVQRADVNVTIGAAPNDPIGGGDFTFPVTLTGQFGGGPTGTVSITYTGNSNGTTGLTALAGGFANVVVDNSLPEFLQGGGYTAQVNYQGDVNFNAVNNIGSRAFTVERVNVASIVWDYGITPPNGCCWALFGFFNLDPDPTWRVTVTQPVGGMPAPTGNVQFNIYTRYPTNVCLNPTTVSYGWTSQRLSAVASNQASAVYSLINNAEGGILTRAFYAGDNNYFGSGTIETRAYGLGCIGSP